MPFVVFPFISQVIDVVPKCSMVAPPYAFKIAGDGSRTPRKGKILPCAPVSTLPRSFAAPLVLSKVMLTAAWTSCFRVGVS